MIKILIPTDFSKPSLNALKYAITIAKTIDAELTLFHAVDTPSHSATLMRDIDDKVVEGAQADFDNFYEEVKAQLDLKKDITRVMHIGKPAESIVEFCNDHLVDLIVMGNTGEAAMHKLFMGSNTQNVIELSVVPVIAVPHNSTKSVIKEIVYATDMKDTTDELQRLVDFAKFFDAKVNVLHIYRKESESHIYDNELIEARLKDKHNYSNIHFHTEINSDVEDGIAHYVIAKQADILAMFAKKRSFFERLFEKSFTQNIADENDLPLFIYKKDGSDD